MEAPHQWPTGVRHPFKEWWSACILSSHCHRPTGRPQALSPTATSTTSPEVEDNPRWSNSSPSHQVVKQVLTTTVTLDLLGYTDALSTFNTITSSTSAGGGGDDALTLGISSSADAVSITPSTHFKEPTQSDASLPLSSTPTSIPSPPTPSTPETTLESSTPPPPAPATSNTLPAVSSIPTQATDSLAVPIQTPSPDLTEPIPPAEVTDSPPVPEDSTAEPGSSAVATPAVESTMAPTLISPVGSPEASASPVPLNPAPSGIGTDITMTPTPAQTTGASSTSDLCLTNPLDPLCPLIPATVTQSPTPQQVDPALCGVVEGVALRTCPTTSTTSYPQPTPGTTGDIIVSDGHVTSLKHSSTMSTTSFTCDGNSDSCYCLSGTCHTQTTFATKTLSAESAVSAATTTTSAPASLNTSAPTNTTITSPHTSTNALPIALGITVPLALIFLLLAIFSLWRRLHRKSYDVYSSYCPLHNTYRGTAAILARWKLTRQRNRAARARGYSGGTGTDTAALTIGSDGYGGSEKYSMDTWRSFDDKHTPRVGVGVGIGSVNTFGVARQGDTAANPLARWRREQQDRLKKLEGRQEEETSREAAETLRRYEIERVKRLKDFGVGEMRPEVREGVFGEKGKAVKRNEMGPKTGGDGGGAKGHKEDAVDEIRVASPSSRTLGGSTQRGSGASDDNWL